MTVLFAPQHVDYVIPVASFGFRDSKHVPSRHGTVIIAWHTWKKDTCLIDVECGRAKVN